MNYPGDMFFDGISRKLTLDYANRKPLFSRTTTWTPSSELNSVIDLNECLKKHFPSPVNLMDMSQGEHERPNSLQDQKDLVESSFATESLISAPPAPPTEDVVVCRINTEDDHIHLNDRPPSNVAECILPPTVSSGPSSVPEIECSIFNGLIKYVAERAKQPSHVLQYDLRFNTPQKRGFSYKGSNCNTHPEADYALQSKISKSTQRSLENAVELQKRLYSLPGKQVSSGAEFSTSESGIVHTPILRSQQTRQINAPRLNTFSLNRISSLARPLSEEKGIHLFSQMTTEQTSPSNLLMTTRDSIHSIRGSQTLKCKRRRMPDNGLISSACHKCKVSNSQTQPNQSHLDMADGAHKKSLNYANPPLRFSHSLCEPDLPSYEEDCHSKGVQTNIPSKPKGHLSYWPRASITPLWSSYQKPELRRFPAFQWYPPYTPFYHRQSSEYTIRSARPNTRRAVSLYRRSRLPSRSPQVRTRYSQLRSTRSRYSLLRRRRRRSLHRPVLQALSVTHEFQPKDVAD